MIPIIDPRYVSGKEAKLVYSACIFVEKAATQYWMPGQQEGFEPTPNGYGSPGQMNALIAVIAPDRV